MGRIRDAFNAAWSDGPSSAPDEPNKPDIRRIGSVIDERVNAAIDLSTTSIQWKQPVKVASTSFVPLDSGLENGDFVDGVQVATGDRVLLLNQNIPSQNGIFVVTASGAAVRSTDANEAAEVLGMAVYVRMGTQAGKQFVCVTPAPISVGNTALAFVQLSEQTPLPEWLTSQNWADAPDDGTFRAKTDRGHVLFEANVRDGFKLPGGTLKQFLRGAFQVRNNRGFVFLKVDKDGRVKTGPAPVSPWQPVVPDRLFMVAERPYPLFVDQLFGDTPAVGYRASLLSRPDNSKPPYVARVSGGSVLPDTKRLASTTTLLLQNSQASGDAFSKFNVATTVIPPASVSGLSKRVLFIGDSLTQWAGLSVQAIRRLQGMGATITPIGTVTMRSNVPGDGTELGEGRTGREYADYINEHTDVLQPLPVGNEATYLALPSDDRVAFNPFIRVATGSDPAARVFNGYIFDLRFYLTRFGFSDPDVVVINLGTNDILQNRDADAVAQVTRGLTVMTAQIRAALPAAKILVTSNATGRKFFDDRWGPAYQAVNAEHVRFVRASGDTNLFNVPLFCTVDRDSGYDVAGTLNANTGEIVGTVDDDIHYGPSGLCQAGEVLAAFIAGAALS